MNTFFMKKHLNLEEIAEKVEQKVLAEPHQSAGIMGKINGFVRQVREKLLSVSLPPSLSVNQYHFICELYHELKKQTHGKNVKIDKANYSWIRALDIEEKSIGDLIKKDSIGFRIYSSITILEFILRYYMPEQMANEESARTLMIYFMSELGLIPQL